MFQSAQPVIQPGSTILVTGVSGFIGSHIAQQLLDAGYCVVGVTRDANKNAWLNTLFGKYDQGSFTLCKISNLANSEILASHLQGVSGIVHTASDMTFGADPNVIIPPVVSAAVSILEAAAASTSVERVVFTSSCAAAAMPTPGHYPNITSESWNDEALEKAWAAPPYNPDRGFMVYAASKTAAEKEVWNWYREKRPPFILNTVLPSANFGRSLDLVNQGHPSTSGLIQALYTGNHEAVLSASEYFYIDVEDSARLHLAALLHPTVTEERIFAYAKPYTWRMVQNVMREIFPNKDLTPDIRETEADRSVVTGLARSEGLLKEMGKAGYTDLHETVRLNTVDFC